MESRDVQILDKLEAILAQIENDQGGEYRDGREALERLKSHLEKKTAQPETKNVGSQIETIHSQLASLDAKVSAMSQSARDMVSFAAQDVIESMLNGPSGSAQDDNEQ